MNSISVARCSIGLFVCALSTQLVWTTSLEAQTLRICSYNIEDRPTTPAENQDLQVIIQAIGDLEILGNSQAIDILAFQEGPEDASEYPDVEASFEAVFGGNYVSTLSNPDFFGCRTGFIYNADRVMELSSTNLSGGLTHNILRTRFRPVDGSSDDEFYMYSIHLKAGQSDASIRAAEAAILRTNAETLAGTANIIYSGDFNIRGSTEAAYQEFFATGDNASAIDSWNTPFGFRDNVLWNDNLAFQPFHTQDPVSNMDDRFDAIFFNNRLADGIDLEYVRGSVSVLGNNGSHNLGQGVNTGDGTGDFGSALIAFSDHLPVICDFSYGKSPVKFNANITAEAVQSRTVRASGPVTGSSGDNFLNVEGSDNGTFASFGVLDFDISGQLGKSETAETAGDILLQLKQSNAGFSSNGPISVYVTTAAAAQVPIDGSIQYQSGQNNLDCVPLILSEGALKVATHAAVHRSGNGGGSTLPDGTDDPILLYDEAIQLAIVEALNSVGSVRLLLTPDEAATAATYAGFSSSLGGPAISAILITSDGSVDVLPDEFSLLVGEQGPGVLGDLNESDDKRIRFLSEAPAQNGAPWIELVLNGTLTSPTPSSLSVTLETRVNTPNIQQIVELFDFKSQSWEQIDVSNAQHQDVSLELIPGGDPTRFVGINNLVLSRVSWRATGPVLFFPWAADIDLFKWSISP